MKDHAMCDIIIKICIGLGREQGDIKERWYDMQAAFNSFHILIRNRFPLTCKCSCRTYARGKLQYLERCSQIAEDLLI